MNNIRPILVAAVMAVSVTGAGYEISRAPALTSGQNIVTVAGPVTNEGNKCCRNKAKPRKHTTHFGSGR